MKRRISAALLFVVMISVFFAVACFALHDSPTFALPPHLKTLEEEAFFGTAIHSLTIPDGVQTLEAGVFGMIHDLKRVYISSSVVRIEETAFDGSEQLTLYCEKGSYTEKWAKQNGYSYVLLSGYISFDENKKNDRAHEYWILIVLIPLTIRQLTGFRGRNSKECVPRRPREKAVLHTIAYSFP